MPTTTSPPSCAPNRSARLNLSRSDAPKYLFLTLKHHTLQARLQNEGSFSLREKDRMRGFNYAPLTPTLSLGERGLVVLIGHL